ncbi:hypothetical protein DH2020_048486 [Rehmannia glutinosa]|uniref:Uncharacterized protein n=1 Tax=Rehmannia glutinosa TaxID=99300 RepID=A0ABR0U5L1_REHGL
MEAMKERKEQQSIDKDPMGNKAREVIREAIIGKSDCGEADHSEKKLMLLKIISIKPISQKIMFNA